MSTNFLWRVLVHPSANATEPVIPSAGSNIASITGWFAIGSVDRGDDADLDADSIEVAMFDEFGEILPPVALVRQDVVPFQNGVDSFELACYDASAALLAVASDITASSGTRKTLTSVKRSVILETNGHHFDYFPNVELSVMSLPVGIAGDGQSKTLLTGRVCAGSVITQGHVRRYYT